MMISVLAALLGVGSADGKDVSARRENSSGRPWTMGVAELSLQAVLAVHGDIWSSDLHWDLVLASS